jgi:Gamma-glutamyl cyclotransferase, AIG2-like
VNLIEGAEVWLFSYGTLRQREVQLAIFGRALEGRADVLPGYALSHVQISDTSVIATSGTAHHTIARETGDPLNEVPGIVFRITQAELAAADAYERSTGYLPDRHPGNEQDELASWQKGGHGHLSKIERCKIVPSIEILLLLIKEDARSA